MEGAEGWDMEGWVAKGWGVEGEEGIGGLGYGRCRGLGVESVDG